MRKSIILLTGIVGLVLLAFATPTRADEEGKKITITGTGKCGKCALHETAACQNVIEVEKGGKTTKFYLAKNDMSNEFHDKNLCKGSKKVKATGTVKEVDGKKELTVTKIDLVEEKIIFTLSQVLARNRDEGSGCGLLVLPAKEYPAEVTPTTGQTVTLTISDIAFGGEGVGRLNDLVVFVPFVAPGEVVEANITEVKKNFARAKLVRVLQASPERVEPACRYFGDCGGCQYQHLSYPTQLALKHKQICDLFERIGGFDPGLIAPVLPCPQPYGYRNRIMIRSQWDKFKQGLNIGFIRNDNRLVVDIEECPIAEPAINEQIARVRAHPPPKGGLKVVLRISPEGWQVPPDSFFQNNFFLLPKLIEVVRERLKNSGARHLVDVYCGVGFFGLELAGIVDSFVGIELDRLAIQAARQNAEARGCKNGEFAAGTAEELLPGLLARFSAPRTTVLLDPPRKGCAPETIELLRRVRPSQILYVSCHPATMARDLNILCSKGVFQLAQVVPLDMFPQTSHVESVADVRCRIASSGDGASARN